ncbi:MAG: hypothetical protein M3Q74_08945, partial [Pseudomonadota bacterium]|nr:hypothetical protein [Pseudomonadota bacterium]
VSPFDVAEQEQNALRSSLLTAAKADPEAAAVARRRSIESGVTPQVATEYKDVFQQREEAAALEQELKDKPVLKRVMSDPNIAPIAKDDVGPALGPIEILAAGLKSGFYNLRSGVAATQMSANQRMLSEIRVIEVKLTNGQPILPEDDQMGLSQATPEMRATMRESLERAAAVAVIKSAEFSRRGSREMQKVDPSVLSALQADTFSEFWNHFSKNPLEYMAVLTAQQASQNLPTILGGMAGGAIGGPAGAMVVGGAMSFSLDYGASVMQALGEIGVDTNDPAALAKAVEDPTIWEKVRKQAHTHATVVGSLDSAGVGAATRIFAPRALGAPGVGRTVARETTNLTAQAGIQGVTGAAGEAIATEAIGGQQKAGELMAEALGGAGVAGGNIAAQAAVRTRQELKAATHQRDQVQQLIDAAAGSKLRERDPAAFRKFVDEVSVDGFETVYVDGAVLNQLLAASGEEGQKIVAAIPALLEQLAEAALGSDVEIQTADLATHFAGTGLAETLVDHVRSTAGGKSYAELAQAAVRIEADAEKTADQASDPKVWRESQQQVADAVYTQIIATGAFGHEQARVNSILTAAMFATQAGRMGKMPHEMAAQYGLTVLDEASKTPEAAWNTLVQDLEAAKAAGDEGAARRITVQLQALEGQVKAGNLKQRIDQIQSPEFKTFFGESKAVDKTGTPLMVYHGTQGDFDTFDRNRGGEASRSVAGNRGFFFTNNPDVASRYATELGRDTEGANIMPAFLSLQNPFELDMEGAEYDEGFFNVTLSDAKENGFDGAIIRNVGDDPAGNTVSDVYVAFKPTQVKSAIGNNGAFDAKNPSVLKQSLGARLATNKNPQVDPVTDTDGITLDHMRAAPDVLEKNVATILGYTGMAPQPEGATIEDKVQAILEFMSDNLLWLY